MDIAAEEAFDAFCKATGVRDSQIGLVRHGWTAAINWRCSAPSASANMPRDEICPHRDTWTIISKDGEVMYKIPACIRDGGQTSPVG
jgi:hypothetical protein